MDTLSGSRSIPVGRWPLFVGVCGLLAARACVCGGWCGGLFVICIVVVSIFFVLWFCLVVWGIRWMPWHQELMKDVAACDMPRGVCSGSGGGGAYDNSYSHTSGGGGHGANGVLVIREYM